MFTGKAYRKTIGALSSAVVVGEKRVPLVDERVRHGVCECVSV